MKLDLRPDVRNASPLYQQLARELCTAIGSGRYHTDEALPSERLLSESLNVSRVTAREAIDQLVEQGLIVRRRGSGNYIAPRIEQPLSRLTSLSENCNYLTGERQVPVRALRHIRAHNALAKLAEQLGVPLGQAVLFITRIGYLETGQAVELTRSWFHSDYCDFVAEMKRDA